jgi:hypothetical protein
MEQPDLGTAGGMGAVDPMAEGGGMEDPMGGGGFSDSLSDNELGAMDDVGGPDVEAMLNDPSMSPEDRQVLEQQILMAARRQIAGM